MEESISPGATMGRSFLLVAACYLGYVALVFGICAAIFALAFPEESENWVLDPEDFAALKANEPEKIVPPVMNPIITGLSIVSAFMFGWLVARFAPLSPFGHGVFLAMAIGVTWFQVATGESALARWVILINIAACPLVTLFGASLVTNTSADQESNANDHIASQ